MFFFLGGFLHYAAYRTDKGEMGISYKYIEHLLDKIKALFFLLFSEPICPVQENHVTFTIPLLDPTL